MLLSQPKYVKEDWLGLWKKNKKKEENGFCARKRRMKKKERNMSCEKRWVKKWLYDEEKTNSIKWRKVENSWMCRVMKVILVLKVVELKIRRLSSFIW